MAAIMYSVGFIFRETGRALDSLGCRLEGHTRFLEECMPVPTFENSGNLSNLSSQASCTTLNGSSISLFVWRHKSLQNLNIRRPTIGNGAFVAPSATLVGKVEVGENANIWYGAVVRGDVGSIKIGKNTNLQDGVLIRSIRSSPGTKHKSSVIGNNVTIGHGATLNGVTIEDEVLVGIGAVLQQGVKVEQGAMIAAGAVVEAGQVVPKGELWGGNPAKKMRSVKPEESDFLLPSAQKYVELAKQHETVAR